MQIKLYHIKFYFGKIKVKWFWKFTKKVTAVYEYWIEFRVDEKRFWYGETKPVFNYDKGIYEIKTNFILTKNGLEGSLNLIKEIESRIRHEFPTIKFDKDENPNAAKYRMYDNIKRNNNDSSEKKEMSGIFLHNVTEG